MVPWPIALIVVVVGIDTAHALVKLWRVVTGVSNDSWVPLVIRLTMNLSLLCGLSLLKSWGRRLAIFVFGGLILIMVVDALSAAGRGDGVGALIATLSSVPAILAVYYLRQPSVKRHFHLSKKVSDTSQSGNSAKSV